MIRSNVIRMDAEIVYNAAFDSLTLYVCACVCVYGRENVIVSLTLSVALVSRTDARGIEEMGPIEPNTSGGDHYDKPFITSVFPGLLSVLDDRAQRTAWMPLPLLACSRSFVS